MNRVILFVTLLISLAFFLFYGKKSPTFYADALGYYAYLPSIFIYDNLDQIDSLPEDKEIKPSIITYFKGLKEPNKTPKGTIINGYTYGVALMELPFFAIAHLYEKVTGRAANGYSVTYDNMIKICTLLYVFLGLFIVYKILLLYNTQVEALITTSLVFIGTNLFWFSLLQSGMAHVFLFFLYALLIHLTIKVHRSPATWIFILMGGIVGLITLIRPTDIVCLFIPLLYDVHSNETFREKVRFIKTNMSSILIAAAAFLIPLLPQVLFWKILAGEFLFDTYHGQSFDFTSPKIIQGLFYFANGWIPYSPIMIFALIGMFFRSANQKWFYSIWAVFLIFIYIIYSWWSHSYINGLGSRPMIHIYPLLAIPLAIFIRYIAQKGILLKFSTLILALFFIAINLSYSVQAAKGILWSENSNIVFNLQTLFRYKLTYNDLVCLDTRQVQPDHDNTVFIASLGCNNYEDSVSKNYIPDTSRQSNYTYKISANKEFPPASIQVPYNDALFKEARWIKCSGLFMVPEVVHDLYSNHLFVIDIKRGDSFLFWRACMINNKIGLADNSCGHTDFDLRHIHDYRWGKVSFYIEIPKDLQNGDKISLGIWNIGKRPLFVDDICIELWK